MRLVVCQYERDEEGSLDCILCDEGDVEHQFTSIVFYDELIGTNICVCPEHLNDMVVAALKRHKNGLKENNPFWYLDPEKDPWEEYRETYG